MKKESILICFTASYPYGNRETYFDTELKYLSSAYDKIIIFPRYNPYSTDERRKVPRNVEIMPPLVPQGVLRVVKGVFNLSPMSFYWSDFFNYKVYASKVKLKKWLNSLLGFRITFRILRKYLRRSQYCYLSLYSYWAEAPIMLTKEMRNLPKIVRMHGGDFYLDRNSNYLPLRQDIYKRSDLLLPISKDIKEILLNIYHVDKKKVYLNYLGIDNNKTLLVSATYTNPIVIVSCSNVIKLKRVDLIFKTLQLLPNEYTIIWHHFGDGPNFSELSKLVNNLKSNVKCNLHGWKTPQDLFTFYAENPVTWFINVSKYEGVPVSIMEAFSFSIPAIATDVGGTSEIVNLKNGCLLPVDFEPNQLLDQILMVYDSDNYLRKRRQAYQTWKGEFEARRNYQNLIVELKRLEKKMFNDEEK